MSATWSTTRGRSQATQHLPLGEWLRDYKNTFSCPSVILTVMLGGRVQFWDTDTTYADVPTALVTLLETLDSWLSWHPSMPLLHDPSCPGLSFNHRWDEDKYANFKKKVSDYAAIAREALDLQGDDDQAALKAWQKMFGPEFAATEVAEARAALSAKAIDLSHGTAGFTASKAIDAAESAEAVEAGEAAAPGEEFITNKYGDIALAYDARLSATIPGSRRNTLLRQQRVVGIHRTLRFHLSTDVPEPYKVLWKVRNRGPEAARVPGGLRGQIRDGGNEGRNLHRESTLYRGQHYVEAYVVKNGVVVASDHHEVTII